MVVHRQEKGEEEIEVELQKKSGKGAGLCLTGYKSGKGAYVSDLVRLVKLSPFFPPLIIIYRWLSCLAVAPWKVEKSAKAIEWWQSVARMFAKLR